MERITKKHFKELHSRGKLSLLSGAVVITAREVFKQLKEYRINDLKTFYTTRVDLNDTQCVTIVVYCEEIQGVPCYVVEENYSSITYSIVYKKGA